MEMDVVKLYVWKEAFKGLSNIIEALIESPNRAFHRDYWQEVVKVEQHLKKTKTWSLEDKIKKLKVKSNRKNFQRPAEQD